MMDLKTFKDWLLNRPSIPPEELRRFTEAARRPPSASVKERTPDRRRAKALAGRTLARLMEQSSPTLSRLRECCDQADLDAGDYTLRGVRVLGETSLNRRRYTREAMAAALPMYQGAKVFLDHPDNPSKSRSVKDLIGTLENVAPAAGGLSADLHLNPAHPYAAAIAWLAKNRPSAIGLSHNAIGEGETKDGVFVVKRIVSVRSVDLVIDPATVRGLFS